jgi:hypothetical protein
MRVLLAAASSLELTLDRRRFGIGWRVKRAEETCNPLAGGKAIKGVVPVHAEAAGLNAYGSPRHGRDCHHLAPVLRLPLARR